MLELDKTTKKKGLSSNELKNLTVFQFKNNNQNANVESNDKTCSICYEEFSANQMLVPLACLHKFHQKCINPWLKVC